MAREAPRASERPDFLLTEGSRNYHLGVALLLAGVGVMIACFCSEYLLGFSGIAGNEAFAVYLIGNGGFALFLAGAVFFVESRAFLRRNRPAT